MSNLIDCGTSPIKDLNINSGWWVGKMYNKCGTIGTDAMGGNPSTLPTCPKGIVKVEYGNGSPYVSRLKFTCDDNSSTGLYGTGEGQGFPLSSSSFVCPNNQYLSKIGASTDASGLTSMNFACTELPPPIPIDTSIASPITTSNIANNVATSPNLTDSNLLAKSILDPSSTVPQDSTASSTSTSSYMWVYIGAGILFLLITIFLVYKYVM